MKVGIFTSHSRWVKPGYFYRATTISSKPYKFDLKVYKTFTGFSNLYPCADELTSVQMTQQVNNDGQQGFQILLLGDGEELSEPKPISDFDLLIGLSASGQKCVFYDKNLLLISGYALSEHLEKHGVDIQQHQLDAWMNSGVYVQTFIKLLMEKIDDQCETNYKEDLKHINWSGELSDAPPKKKVPVTKWILKGGKVSFPVQEEPKPEPVPAYTGFPPNPSDAFFSSIDANFSYQESKAILKAKLAMKLEQEKAAATKQTYHYEDGKVVGVTISSNTPPKPSGFSKKKFDSGEAQKYKALSKAWSNKTKVE